MKSRCLSIYSTTLPFQIAQNSLLPLVNILGRNTVLASLDARLSANILKNHEYTHFCLAQALSRIDEMSMNPEVEVGSKPPISSMEENLASYNPSSESRPSTMTFPL